MTSRYILLNEAFCTAHTGHTNASGMFNYGITLLGYYVAAEQTFIDFPELFQGELVIPGIVIIVLEVTDFPIFNLPI